MLNIHIFARKVGEKEAPNFAFNIQDGGFVILRQIEDGGSATLGRIK